MSSASKFTTTPTPSPSNSTTATTSPTVAEKQAPPPIDTWADTAIIGFIVGATGAVILFIFIQSLMKKYHRHRGQLLKFEHTA
ncbi:hypothetical protein F5Y08DRAFT_336078 [Xylaria arbuscula]|nr:hypothetical protein F5Y08DRAFT_336078 [Xylaria arbuscula]